MTVELRITGANDLAALGRDLVAMGEKDLIVELKKSLQRAVRDSQVKEDIARSAMATLPRKGGLAETVAGMHIATKVNVTGRAVGVRLRGDLDNVRSTRERKRRSKIRRDIKKALGPAVGMGPSMAGGDVKFGSIRGYDLRRMDAGRIRHPTYGHMPWKLQEVRPNFWSGPMNSLIAERCRRECINAIAAAAAQFAAKGKRAA